MIIMPDIATLAADVIALSRAHNIMIATAESCTGGLISGALTEIPGSSAVLDRGFVTYSNAAKMTMLGVAEALLVRHGAVSAEVAYAMAEGALAHSLASLTIAVTGIAGPGGGSAEKPVGRVHIALARSGHATQHEQLDLGDIGRTAIRERTIIRALEVLRSAIR